MKKYKAYRVAIKFPLYEHWRFTWKMETECDLYSPDYCGKRKAIRRAILKEKGLD